MSTPVFERAHTVEPGVCDQLSGLVRRVTAPNASPYTFTGTATYIVGQGEVAVIDPGPARDDHLAALLAALAGEKVAGIFVTHTHTDHSPLARALADKTQAPIYSFGAHGAGAAGRPNTTQIAGEKLDMGVDLDFTPDTTLRHGQVVHGAGWSLEAVHTPGHTSNHLCFALPQEKTLFTGDHVMGWSTTLVSPPDGHMGDYMASLRQLLDRGEQLYWPGHGGVVHQPRRFVRALVGHREAREATFLKRLKSGDRTVGDIVKAVYSGLSPKLHYAAALTTLAHLIALSERGKIAPLGPHGLDTPYQVMD
ncbi:MAG: MBL fold metallo-hydrolase [Alphaproteobacteria bacterium]